MSSTMISKYRTKLISKEILQKKLEELTESANKKIEEPDMRRQKITLVH